MPADRLIKAVQNVTSAGGKCLMPYLTAGFPDLDTTVQLVARCDAAGCPAIEIGFPFSDSIADGPVIQESFYRALDAGFRVDDLLEAVRGLRGRTSAALVAMVSMSLVAKRGAARFAADAAQAGFDGLIVPDVPIDEAECIAEVTSKADLCNILMVAPTSSPERRKRIADASRGFLYVIASRGITGERERVAAELADQMRALRALTRTPLIAGFGISTAEQVREVCRHADGVIVGSAIVRRIADCIDAGQRADGIVAAIGGYVDELMTGTDGRQSEPRP